MVSRCNSRKEDFAVIAMLGRRRPAPEMTIYGRRRELLMLNNIGRSHMLNLERRTAHFSSSP